MESLVPPEDSNSDTPTMRSPPISLPFETRVLGGRYRVRRLLGRGGMADVFLGDDLLLERAVAIKILHPGFAADSSGLERFRREATTLAAIRCRHIVGIFDIGFDDDGVYLVMQHIDGQTIEQEIARTGPMSRARAEAVIVQLLDGLAEMHARGLVHRDVKPSNVLLGASDRVVLLDLGIVLDTRRAPLTAPGMVAGTPGFLAPESRTRAECELTSDVYQVGLLTLFVLTGVDFARRAPTRDFEDLIQRLPVSLGAIVRRALAVDPAERFPSAAMMKEALEAAIESAAGSKRRSGSQSKLPRHLARARGEHQPLLRNPTQESLLDTRTTTELSAAQLVALLTDSIPARPAEGLRPQREIKTIELRAAQIVSAHPVDRQLATAGTRIQVIRPQSLAGRPSILIVDEDLAFCGTLHRMLKSSHDVRVVNEPSQVVVQIVAGARVDVILCGLSAPMEFHDALRATHPDHVSNIIFMKGRDISKETRSFLAKVTNKCLGKPFEIALLKRLIDAQVVGRRALVAS